MSLRPGCDPSWPGSCQACGQRLHAWAPHVCPGSNPAKRADRIAFLERKREATKADLLLKFEDGDWHGCWDCAIDLERIDAELKGLRY